MRTVKKSRKRSELMKHKVALVKCGDYGQAAEAVEKAFSLLELDAEFFTADGQVLLKPNLLSRREPKRAVTTHPALAEAVIAGIRSRKEDADLAMGDSPGGALKRIKTFWDKTGFSKASENTGVPLVSFDDAGSETIPAEAFPKLGSFTISKAALEPAMLINVPKLKTHSLTYMTAAMKNLYGLIPGLQKAAIHKAIPDQKTFAKFLAHLNTVVQPDLHVVDAVTAMEGNGPASGTPRDLGLIIVGTNALAVDMVCAAVINIPWQSIGHITEAINAELGPESPEQIEVLGESIDSVKVTSFKLPSSYYLRKLLSGVFIRLLKRFVWVRPRVEHEECKRCRRCVDSCPVQAMNMHDNGIDINYKTCINCMCCHELCEYNAVKLDFSFLARFMFNTRDYGKES